MTIMPDRVRAFENKFAHDEELRFKAEARRNKMVGLWAAGLLGHPEPDLYAREVAAADFEELGHEDVVRKLKADFEAAGMAIDEADIRARMDELMHDALSEVDEF